MYVGEGGGGGGGAEGSTDSSRACERGGNREPTLKACSQKELTPLLCKQMFAPVFILGIYQNGRGGVGEGGRGRGGEEGGWEEGGGRREGKKCAIDCAVFQCITEKSKSKT